MARGQEEVWTEAVHSWPGRHIAKTWWETNTGVWDDAGSQIVRLCAVPLPSFPQERARALRRAGIGPGLFVALFSGLPLFSQTAFTSGKGCASHCLLRGPQLRRGRLEHKSPGERSPVGPRAYFSPRQPLAQGAYACNNNRNKCFWSWCFVPGPV